MLFMVIERFTCSARLQAGTLALCRRFREKGRLAPDGLTYVKGWVETNFDRCFQLMECDDAQLLEQWATHWRDLVDFEFVPVLRSKQAVELITPQL